jgi:hypothetical protein
MNDEAQEGNGQAEDVEVGPPQGMPDLPELFITPFGMRVEKINHPVEGQIALIKVLTPGMIYTIKLSENQTKELGAGLTGGIHVASVADLAQLKGR